MTQLPGISGRWGKGIITEKICEGKTGPPAIYLSKKRKKTFMHFSWPFSPWISFFQVGADPKLEPLFPPPIFAPDFRAESAYNSYPHFLCFWVMLTWLDHLTSQFFLVVFFRIFSPFPLAGNGVRPPRKYSQCSRDPGDFFFPSVPLRMHLRKREKESNKIIWQPSPP